MVKKKQYNPLLDISKVIDYLWHDEERHYEESMPSERRGHIFTVLKRLRLYAISECGKKMDKGQYQ